MAPKSKLKKSAAADTPRKRGKETARRKQPLSDFPPNHMGELNLDESEPSLMNLLVDMNARLATNKQFVEDLRATEMAQESPDCRARGDDWPQGC